MMDSENKSARRLIASAILVPALACSPSIDRIADRCARGDQKSCATLAELARHHKDPQVRLSATARLTDEAVLVDVARSEQDVSVRAVALTSAYLEARVQRERAARLALVAKAGDPRELSDLARTDWEGTAGKAAVAKLEDPMLLANLAVSAESVEVRMAAVAKIPNQKLLTGVAQQSAQDPWVRAAAVRQLLDQDLLVATAVNSREVLAVRVAATEALANPQMLLTVARSSPEQAVRCAAVRNAHLLDQVALAEIAQRDKDGDVRTYAALRVADQAIYARLLREEKDAEVRQILVRQLKDQAALAALAKNDRDPGVAAIAASRLTSSALLSDLARSRSVPAAVRCVAAENGALTDAALWADLVSDSDECLRRAAAGKLQDQKLLAAIAASDPSESVRAEAVDRVTDSNLVARLALADPSQYVRYWAVARVTDQNLLEKVARMDRHWDVRLEAARRLQDRVLATQVIGEVALAARDSSAQLEALGQAEQLDQPVFATIATKNPNELVREVAVWALEDPGALADIARTDRSERVRTAAAQHQWARTLATDCEKGNGLACGTLASAARTSGHIDGVIGRRRAAIRCLADEGVLIDVARHGDVRERQAAVENRRLVDQAVLAEIAAKEGEDLFVRRAAIRKLSNRDLLLSLSAHEELTVRWAASDRMVALPSPAEANSSAARRRDR